jgi:hypothetical protein
VASADPSDNSVEDALRGVSQKFLWSAGIDFNRRGMPTQYENMASILWRLILS